MLPLEALRSVRKVITHKNCPDGRASALILRAALPSAEIVEMAYNEAAHDSLEAVPGLLFCDFTPPKDRLGEFVAAGSIVLDHHTRDLVSPFGDLGVFGRNEDMESGALLAYREVFLPLSIGPRAPMGKDDCSAAPWLANLAAIRDTWKRDSPSWEAACACSEALRFVPLPDLLIVGVAGFQARAAELGHMLLRKKREAAAEAARNAVCCLSSVGNIAVVSSVTLTSDVADLVDADIVAGFDYVQENGATRLQWSLRSRGDIDVSAIARRHGGNGHKPAAGFSVPDDGRSPYARIGELLGA